ncbi:circadian clock protein KaiA [[Limnothrix rosea] IAM M-220]|uniref:circadian clock protein KaiA n=1 Tax=[Limnothrix rosea] IAM M-220 TaxID=454133 RepID=UPI00398D5AB4
MSKLLLFTLGLNSSLKKRLASLLEADRYSMQHFQCNQESYKILAEKKENIDCLITMYTAEIGEYFQPLSEAGIVLPNVILIPEKNNKETEARVKTFSYHSAEKELEIEKIDTLGLVIDQAITQFLYLAPSCTLIEKQEISKKVDGLDERQAFLLLQQRRLADKLKERLGYLGVYYKRNPQYFYRNLSPEDKHEFRQQFRADYREIVLDYFNGNPPTNQAIDQFVNQAFFADVSVSYILETHMSLMDEFAQQLKLEGRSEDILLDYRLTLIDIVAHLCEMYRRSIPKEDLPFELLFRMD